jgi:hypothetical protein
MRPESKKYLYNLQKHLPTLQRQVGELLNRADSYGKPEIPFWW